VEFCYWLEFEGDIEGQKLEARFHIHGKHNRHCESEDSVDGVRPSESDSVARTQVKYRGGPAASDTVPQSG
jgi:hypothetical protein